MSQVYFFADSVDEQVATDEEVVKLGYWKDYKVYQNKTSAIRYAKENDKFCFVNYFGWINKIYDPRVKDFDFGLS